MYVSLLYTDTLCFIYVDYVTIQKDLFALFKSLRLIIYTNIINFIFFQSSWY